MSLELERAAEALFPQNGASQIGNLKFFRGTGKVTAEALADQFQRANAQIEAGESELILDIDGED